MIRGNARRPLASCQARHRRRGLLLVLVLALVAGLAPAPAQATPSYGLSAFGDLRYGPDFKHFDYVNPEAPKSGTLRLAEIGSFDSLNPFILKGNAPASLAGAGLALGGTAFVYESLMERDEDEPDALYGLIAKSVDLSADRSTVSFTLRRRARFHTGQPITAADVVFTFHALTTEGDPRYRFLYRGVVGVTADGPERVTFRLKRDADRSLPLLIARMPILSHVYFADHAFDRSGWRRIPGSGPYRIGEVVRGQTIVYDRVPDYWARDLPVMVGQDNFDRVRVDYYRDRNAALQAFFAGTYDFRQENTAKSWATAYDTPAVKDGRIVREVWANRRPAGVQGFFINTRRAKFADRRVREALADAYDFQWENKHLFYGLYKRTESYFANSPYAASGLPSAAELKLLDPYRAVLPKRLFTEAFHTPTSGGRGYDRANLQKARALLAAAGWRVRAGRLVDVKTGRPMRIQFLLDEPVFERVVAPYAFNLRRLGIATSIRLVDSATYENRLNSFDYDIIVFRLPQPLTPGAEQRAYWGSASADVPGTLNFAGIKSPVVDALIDRLVRAKSRPELEVAAHALDRVLSWGFYIVPHFYSGTYRIAFWNKFGRPKIRPRYSLGVLDTWWYEPRLAAMLKAGKAPPPPRPRLP